MTAALEDNHRLNTMVIWCVMLTLIVTVFSEAFKEHDSEPKVYTGHAVIRVHAGERIPWLLDETAPGVQYIREFTIIGGYYDLLVPPERLSHITDGLSRQHIKHELLTTDLQSDIDKEKTVTSSRPVNELQPDTVVQPDYYLPYEETVDWLFKAVTVCKDTCSLHHINESYEGRQLIVMQVGEARRGKPAIWLDAGLHAREWIGPGAALGIIAKLINGRHTDSTVERMLDRFTWYIMPLANPDGYAYTWTHDRLWRKTRSNNPNSKCQGTDPNRNWNFQWGGAGTSDDPCSENYHGRAPFSEIEVLAMARFLWRLRQKLSLYVSLHSYGQYWLTPWGYTSDLPIDYDELARIADVATNAARLYNGTLYEHGSSARMLYKTSGGSDDWAKAIAGVKYAYTVELGDKGRFGFTLPPSAIKQAGREMFDALAAVAGELM